jgi:PAS domain S-box-containing protein
MAEKPTYEELENRINQLMTERSRYAKAEAEQKKSVLFTESMLSAIPMAFFFKDVQGRYQGCNPAFTEIMGVTAQEMRGKTVHELWPSEHAEVYHQKDLELMKHPTRQVYEFEIRDKSGTTRPVIFYKNVFHDEHGNVAGLVGGFIDITERKRTDEVLRESEEKYREIANRVPGMVYQFVLHQDGSFSIPFISNQVYEYFGYKPDEVMAEPDLLFKAIHLEDIEFIKEHIAQSAKRLNDFSVEHRLTTPAGEILWFHVKSRPHLLENGDISWNGISIDITERKNIEEELKTSEERYQSVSELTSDYSYSYRVEPDGELILDWVTGALKRLTGFTREEVRSRGGWESLIYPADMSIPLGQLKSLLSNQSTTVEYRIIDKAGNIRWMRDCATPIWNKKENRLKQIYGAVQEFTEQKEAEEALRASHERFLTVLDGIDATIYVADMETYEILFMNKHMKESFSRDMTGEICWDVFRGESGPCPHCTNDRLIDAKGEPTGVFVWQDKNPITQKWYVNYDRAIKWIDDRLVRLQIATDITDLKALEEERLRLEVQLNQAQRMEAIGTLAGGIAHDFNNILSSVIGYSELSLEKAKKGTLLHSNLQEVFNAGMRAKDLVKQILAYSRQTEQELQPIRVKLIVKETLKLLRASLPTTIEIRQNIQSDESVLADATQIHQILMNLCTNAGHAMREAGGTLEVSLSDVELDTEFAAQNPEFQPGVYQILSVSDTGHGISADEMEKIFNPFFTTKQPDEGTGMGLSVVHGIVKSHGGEIKVYSEPGKGSSFNVYLPIITSEEMPKVEVKEALPRGSEHILLVDDEKPLVDIGKHMLERQGYQVTTRTSSIEALELFRAKPDEFDLVVTDMTMPNMTGDKLAKELIRLKPEIPVIICTGYSARINQQHAAAMGIRAIVMKPVVKREIATTVREVLDQTAAKES